MISILEFFIFIMTWSIVILLGVLAFVVLPLLAFKQLIDMYKIITGKAMNQAEPIEKDVK